MVFLQMVELLSSMRRKHNRLYQWGAAWRYIPHNFTFVRLTFSVTACAQPLRTHAGMSSFIHLFTWPHMLSAVHSFPIPFTYSFRHPFTDLFIHLFIHSASRTQACSTLWVVVWKFKFPVRGTTRVKCKLYSRYALTSKEGWEEA